uniref:Interferon-induced, double-stranded RNA-activated protein kinase n=1 Tax=Dicentrarchus labrax TaxID=13489 RepID=A0A8C4IKR0_DICLA
MENYVAKLNEYAQKRRSLLTFEEVGSVGPDHIKTFTLRAVVNGKTYPDGVGKNKKEARQKAAENALRSLLEDRIDSTENAAESSPAPVHQTGIIQTNYICWLNEYGQRNRVTIRAVESTKLGPNNVTICCSFVVGDKEYPTATGKTKREAKEEAAKLVYHEICGSKTTETVEEKNILSSQPEKELTLNVSIICDKTKSLSVTKVDEGFTETNFCGIINNYCQKRKLLHDYVLEKRCGPPHNPQFFYKLVIDNKEYSVGEGKNAKDAKQKAAQLACAALKEERSDWDSKVIHILYCFDMIKCVFLVGHLSGDTKSKSMPTTSNDSVVFTNSSNPPKDQVFYLLMYNQSRHFCILKYSFNPNRFASEYDSIMCLGNGAFGVVFKAKQKLLQKYFAIKIVRCKEKALREVGALSDLHHSNIVRYYTCWLEDSEYQSNKAADSSSSSQSTGDSQVKYLYIQMELCDTKTLRVWIDEKNIQNVKKSLRDSKRREESLTIVKQIVSGVEYIHSMKLIHRDLKPANIMFGQDREVKIGDFGLVTAENNDDENLIERTYYKGTPSYMAPEQKSGKIYDRKVDIFALGLIYFELLWNLSTGQEKKAVKHKICLCFLLQNQIIKSMLCENPEDRPEASKLKMDLEEYTRTLLMHKDMCRDSKTV